MGIRRRYGALCAAVWLALGAATAHAEVVLQYFNTSWRELAQKMPELAEAGYGALWLPPPTKGSGGLSVGYDLWDPFDLGSRDQRGTVRTRYGTEAELLRLIETAHRFGLRVYVDNIMNHRAFDVPGYNEYTPIDIYPGMLPEDFHLRQTAEGFYRKWDNIANWQDTWQIQYRNFSDLIDIAQESPDNGNFGKNEGDHVPKIRFVRHPNNPEFYCYAPGPAGAVYVGFASTNITAAMLTNAANAWLYAEDVGGYLVRAARWLVDRTKVDGLRLDAVKHVPSYFFGEQWSAGKDASDAGYCGQAQAQFNLTRGFNDWNSHRDTVFDTDASFGRNDLMMFGEHLGEPPTFSEYIAAGMRLVNSPLHGFLNGNLGYSWGNLSGLDSAGAQGFSAETGVPYVKSHDDDYATRPELQYAFLLTRRGLPNVYTDGNYQSETLGESGGAFPRHANTAFLGQWGDPRIPNLAYIHNHFARGDQVARWSDTDVAAYERRDKRENGAMDDADGTVLFFVMNDNYAAGQYREISTSFRPGDRLWQYSAGGGSFFYTVPSDRKIKVITPPGGYFAFSWRSPEPSDLWAGSGGRPVTITENGQTAGWISCVRRDGPDGDPAFNPYGVADADATDYAYTYYVPRVTAPTGVRFVCRVDGSAKNVLLKLDGGMDLDGQTHVSGDPRDHPPANEGSTDVFLGYESARFVQRQYREKFAAADTATRNVIGSAGAETYAAVVGTAGFSTNLGATGRDSDADTADWVYHDPTAADNWGRPQFEPGPETAAGSNITIRVKTGYRYQVSRVVLYYTDDGAAWPEGAGGEGRDATRAVEGAWYAVTNDMDWWSCQAPAHAGGAVLRYKIGAFKQQGMGGVAYDAPFPNSDAALANKKSMLGVWDITNFSPSTAVYRPHNDFGQVRTGLVEGFHVIGARAFLDRDGKASIYNTFVQPFYYDAASPTGEVVYPGAGQTLSQNEYGVVVRTDPTVADVWYHIDDVSAANDDAQTGRSHGNGTNAAGETAWVRATQVTPYPGIASAFPDEWRFSYRNVPSGGGAATLRVRLLELSSSTNLALSDAQGHFTTLDRAVFTDGPAYTLFVAYPQHDGDLVWNGYELKVLFSKTLRNTDDETLRSRFLIRLDGAVQGRENYAFHWDVDAYHHELAYALPDLYNGDPQFLHQVQVTHTNAAGGGVTLTADRFVRARETDAGPHVDIVNPPEYDSDGMPYVIVLPDVASPTPDQRQFAIRVETDLAARNVWIAFTNCIGQAVAFATTSNALAGAVSVVQNSGAVTAAEAPLSGTVTVTNESTEVSGSGTAFQSELAPSRRIRVDTNAVVVTQVLSQTSLTIDRPYPGATASGAPAWLEPAFDEEATAGSRLSIAGNIVTVGSVASATNLVLTLPYPGVTASGLTAYRINGNPVVSGSRQYWHFLWTNMTEGRFQFAALVDTNGDPATVEGQALRNATVAFREMVSENGYDGDDDDDGLYDSFETTATNLPAQNAETWLNGDVHVWQVFGRTDFLKPDSDGDGLPDGLESGWRVPIDANHTRIDTDTDGDGFPNFRPDLDPPFYNTVPDNSGLPNYVFYDSRTKLIHGSLTDPNDPDTDHDGLPDGIEDRNRNGWADGDGRPLYPLTSNPWADRPSEADWPDGKWDAAWASRTNRETDPNVSDTDADGLSDGHGEDKDADGWVAGDANSNRAWEAGELWQETDPLNPDTDGDGLPDGWEVRYGLDPWDDGVIGHTNRHTGAVIATNENGAAGNPDGDTVVAGGVTNGYANLMEFENGTHPRIPDTGDPPPAGRIVDGPGPALGTLTGRTNRQEFTEWTIADCLALDEYEGDGGNNQGGDVYKAWDGWDESRDVVAFYAHDGGAPPAGDDRFHFRVDLYDLKALAEEKNLDLYVVIDTGNPAAGEMSLPDDVDTITWCRWEVVVAVYRSGQGRVYIDMNRDAAHNTTAVGQNPLDAQYGVIARDEHTAGGFLDAYFNSELDSVEFSVSRQALLDAGWGGSGATNFNYEVFTTKDGTQNSPVGAGDIGGRSDVRDAVASDFIAEDYWQAQAGLESILKYWIPGTARAGRAKVSVVLHGNQAILPGSEAQKLLNNDAGAGYYRPLEAHALYRKPVNLHVTPTLAAAMQWASVDPAAGKPWLDGPAFNRRVADLVRTNVVYLMGSTFSDHVLPYFTPAYNRDNEALAREALGEIYGAAINRARAVFWTPERVLDADVFAKILDMGYGCTVLDQNTHLFNWYGRTESLVDGAYRINTISGVRCFVLNDIATSYLFVNEDGGCATALRALLSRKARSGTQDQVVTVFANWEDFGNNAKADAYDANVRWLANRPWTELVALEQIAAGEVDAWGDPAGDVWGAVGRGAPGYKQGHNWLNHATREDYDRWYVGAPEEESLDGRRFEIRPGTNVPAPYGMLYTAGVVKDAWTAVSGLSNTNAKRLARAALHASTFETAFHNEDNQDLRRFSTGDYMNPATSSNALAAFARNAQAQTRTAAMYAEVAAWAAAAVTAPQTVAKDVDLDGEAEYLLYNDRLFGVFERIGGRLVAAWARDVVGGAIFQAVGCQPGYAGSDTEREGMYSVNADGSVVAYRTSGLKDWWVEYSPGVGTPDYVNHLYDFAAVSGGWQMTSTPDPFIRKTVTLQAKSRKFEITYQLSGDLAGRKLYVRNGLSPDLFRLMVSGQKYLGGETHTGGVMRLANTGYVDTVTAYVGYRDAGHNAGFNLAARDDNPGAGVTNRSVRMRNQALTHQVELLGTNDTFSFSLGFSAGPSDWDGDGMPNTYEDGYAFLNAANPADGTNDFDGDLVPNADEYRSATAPDDDSDYLHVERIAGVSTGVAVRFQAKANREYRVWYDNRGLMSPAWSNATPAGPITVPTNSVREWVDDGSATAPGPFSVTSRFYDVRATLPE